MPRPTLVQPSQVEHAFGSFDARLMRSYDSSFVEAAS